MFFFKLKWYKVSLISWRRSLNIRPRLHDAVFVSYRISLLFTREHLAMHCSGFIDCFSIHCAFCAAPWWRGGAWKRLWFRIELMPTSTVYTISDWFPATFFRAFSYENAISVWCVSDWFVLEKTGGQLDMKLKRSLVKRRPIRYETDPMWNRSDMKPIRCEMKIVSCKRGLKFKHSCSSRIWLWRFFSAFLAS